MDKEQLVFNSLLKASSDNVVNESRYYDKNDLKHHYSSDYSNRSFTPDSEPKSRLEHMIDASIHRFRLLDIEAARDEHEIRPDTTKFTDDEKTALRDYKGSYSSGMNESLVDHHSHIKSLSQHTSQEEIDDMHHRFFLNRPHIKNVSNAIAKGAVPLPRETHVFSGTGTYTPPIEKHGDILHTPAFTSTSLNPRISAGFSGGHILHFILPKGYNKGMHLDPYNSETGNERYGMGSDEREFLLDHSQHWKCVGKESINNYKKSFFYGNRLAVSKHNIYHLVPHDSNINEAVIHSLVGIQHAVDHPTADSLTLFGSNPHKASLETQHKELAKLHDHKLIPETGRQSLAVYTDTSEYINKPLVSPESYIPHIYAKESKEHTDHISDAISRMPAHDKDIHVYSGTGGFDPTEHIAHGHIHLPAFTSTSLVPNVAATFANWPTGHVMHFILPKGYNKGIYVGHNSNCDVDEREYILDKNQTFKHVGSEHIKSDPYRPGNKREVTFHSFVPISHTIKEAYEHDTSRLRDTYDLKDTRIQPSILHDHEHNLLDNIHGPIKPDIPGFDDFGYSSRCVHCEKLNPGWVGMNQYAGQSADINRSLIHIHEGGDINSRLSAWDKRKINDVDTYLGNTKPLTREHHVYAGLGSFNPETIMKHKKFVMPGFVSTSIDPHVSNVHNNLKGGSEPEHTLHIILPKGYTGGRYIATGPSSFTGEHEITLKRGQRFKFHNKEVLDVGGKTRTIWTVKPLDHLNGKKSKQVKIPLDEATYHEPAAFIYGMNDKWSKTNLGIRKIGIDHDVTHQHEHLMSRQYEGVDHDRDVSSLRKMHQPTIDYTSSSVASSINHRLIDKDSFHDDRPDILTNHIKMYAKALDHEMHVYSGVSSKFFDLDEGSVVHTPAFTSTSLHPNIAKSFSNNHNISKSDSKASISERHVLHFILPKGYNKGMYIGDVSNHKGEFEYLLDKNQKWKVLGTHRKSDVTYPEYDEDKKYIGHTRIVHLIPHDEHVTEAYKGLTTPENNDVFSQHNHALFEPGNVDYYKFQSIKDQNPEVEPRDIVDQHHFLHSIHSHDFEPKHVDVINNYTKGGSGIINHFLIHGPQNPIRNYSHEINSVNHLDDMFASVTPIDHNVHSYSSIGFDPSKIMKEHGGIFKTPAFISSSLNPHVAVDFNVLKNTSMGDHHVVHYDLPKGYTGASYIGGSTPKIWSHQRELLIDRDRMFKLHKRTVVSGPSHSVTVWHVKPYDHVIKEALTHIFDRFDSGNFSRQVTNQDSDAFIFGELVKEHEPLNSAAKEQFAKVKHKMTLKKFSYDGNSASVEDVPHHIHNYTTTDSGIVNHYLIHGGKHNNRYNTARNIKGIQGIPRLKSELNHLSTPLPEDHHVYSALVQFSPEKHFKQNNGVIKMPGFTSTSINPYFVSNWGGIYDEKKSKVVEQHILHFHLPKGYTGGAYVAPHSAHRNEREFLLKPNQKWRLTDHNVATGGFKDDTYHPPIDRHIWSVEPYDNTHLTEALKHDFENHFNTGNKPYVDEDEFLSTPDGTKEHDLLSKNVITHYVKHKDSMVNEDRGSLGSKSQLRQYDVHTVPKHIREYSRGSTHINVFLLKKAGLDRTMSYESSYRAKNAIPKVKKQLKQISTPLTRTHHVYSALTGFDPTESFKQNNGLIHTPAFTSTSINPRWVNSWGTGSYGKDQHHHVMHFILPKGYDKGAYIQPFSSHHREHEFLLQPNQKWQLVKHEIGQTGAEGYDENTIGTRHVWSVKPYEGKMKKGIVEAFKHDTKLTEELISEMDFHSKYLFKDVGGTTGMTYEPWNTKESKLSYAKKIKNLGSFKQAVNMRADARSIEEYNKYVIPRSGLNPIQNRHLDDYVGSHSRLINFVLLHKHSRALGTAMHTSIGNTLKGNYDHISYYHDHINSISDVIRDHAKPLEEETHVYSGLSNFDPRKHFAKSKIVKFPSFISTSFKPATAVAFANRNDANRSWKMDAHIVHFHLPAGYKNGISPPENISEREFILNKGQKWRLVKHEIVNNKNHDTLDENNPLTGPKLKKKYVNRKIHIYTVVPHEDNKLAYHEPMNEAYDHNISSSAFKDFKNSTNEDFYDITGRKAVKKEHESLVKQNLWIDDHKNKEHLYSFTNDSSEINKGLIHKTKFAYSGTKETHQGMQKLFNDAKPLEREHHVYSGLGLFSPEKSLGKHGVFTTPAYISSSINPHVAISHTNYKRSETDRRKIPGLRKANREDLGPQTFDIHEHVMHFILPKGYTKGIYAGGYSNFHGENEMILNRGQKWQTVNHEVKTKIAKVDRWVHDTWGYGKTVKDTHNIHRHIWSVTPHEEDLKESLTYDDHSLKSEWEHLDNENPLHVKDHHEESMHLMNQHKMVIDHETEEGRNKQRDQFIAMIRHTSSSNHLNRKLIMDGEDSLHRDLLTRHTNLKDYLSDTKPLEEVHHVYSSMGSFDPGTIITKDKIFKTPAYVSTSLNPHTAIVGANIFAQRSSGIKYSNEHILHIELPKGYVGGRYLGSHSNYPLEQEFLLRPNQRLKITDKTSISGPNGRMRHVWHAKPLDHLNGVINESTYHDPDVFRQFTSNRDTPSQKVRDFSANLVDKRKASTKDYKKQHFTLLIDRNQHTPLVSGEGNNYDHLYRYTSHAASINNYLIEHHNDPDQYKNIHTEKDIENISGQIKALGHPLHEEMHVYSGIKNLNLHKAFKQHEGIIHTPAFTSTSINPMTARSFAGSDGSTNLVGQNERHVIHFHLPKGYRHGVYVGDISEFENENEFLLNKGQKWKLVNHQKVNDVYHSKYTDPAKKIISPYHIWSVVPHDTNLNEEILNEIEYKKAYFWNSTPKPGVNPKREEDYQTFNLGKNITTRKLSDEEFKAHVSKTISHDEQSSVSHYMGAGSRSINAKLLNDHGIKHNIQSLGHDLNSEETVSHHLNHLDNAFKYHTVPLKQDMEVYSGISGYKPRHIVDNHGVFETPAFTSTSFHPGTSIWMAGRHDTDKNEKHILHFKLPKDYSKGLVTFNGHDEHEMILDRGQKWKIVDHKTIKNYRRATYGLFASSLPPKQTTTHIWSVVPHDK